MTSERKSKRERDEGKGRTERENKEMTSERKSKKERKREKGRTERERSTKRERGRERRTVAKNGRAKV